VRPTFTNLTLSGGDDATGGAVSVGSFAQPRFTQVYFLENMATSLGGAIFAGSSSLVRIEQSRFITNTAGSGGAIYNVGGTIVIDQSVFRGNSSSSGTAGGGAIYSNGGLLDVTNTLFAFNSSELHGGAVRANGGLVEMLHNTIVDNTAVSDGGGFYNAGAAATLTNVLLADNTANNGNAIFHENGTTSLRYSLVQNVSDLAGTISEVMTVIGDPLFADTQYRLAPGSDAVDQGDPDTLLDTDFEGDFRPSDLGHDIGYDELAGCVAQRAVFGEEDSVINKTFGSIQDAINATDPASNLIRVSGICRGVKTETSPEGTDIQQTVYLDQDVHIQGGWDARFQNRTFEETIIDPEGQGRGIYVIGTNISPTLESLTIVNGNATGLGGGLATNADAGGGIYNRNANLTLYGVSIYSSTARYGGGFYNHFGTTSYYNLFPDPNDPNINDDTPRLSHLEHNEGSGTGHRGGAVYTYQGLVLLDGLVIRHNTAESGGAIYLQASGFRGENLILAENSATTVGGGAIYNTGFNNVLWHTTIYSNTATNNGGGIYNDSGNLTVNSSIFQGNTASFGGAIHVQGGSVTSNYNYYFDNEDPELGGSISYGANDIHGPDILPPGLIDPAEGNYELSDNTPAVDAANPNSPLIRDFLGNPRPSNQTADIGAHEVVGCLARIVRGTPQNPVILTFGNIQVALETAVPGETIQVAGRCTGVHPYDTGAGIVYQTVHLNKDVSLEGGWRPNFSQRDDITLLDAEGMGRVLYIDSGITNAIVEGFHMVQGDATANGMNGQGGGIFVEPFSSPRLWGNEIYSNTAVLGGAIYAQNSSPRLNWGNRIFANEASSGGGIYIDNNADEQEAFIQNNFIYSNTAQLGGGFYNAAGDNRFWHNTLLYNTATNSNGGGGVYVAADTPTIRNNIIVNSSGYGLFAAAAATPDFGYNNFFENTPANFSGVSGQYFEFDPAFNDPAELDFTIAITSPMANRGDMLTPLTRDFEGDIRPSNQGYDIGADEIGGCFARLTRQPNIIYGSVQIAVNEAVTGDIIQVSGICQNVNSVTLTGTNTVITQHLYLDKEVIIDGAWNYQNNGPGVIDALGLGRVAYIGQGAVVTMTNITLQGGNAAAAGINNWGGGLLVEGRLTLEQVVVRWNNAERGGGIYNIGTLILGENSQITENGAQLGAGFYNGVQGTGSATINNVRFFDNAADINGGAVYQATGALRLDGNRLYENEADRGGAIYLQESSETTRIYNNFIYDNQGRMLGGGIYNSGNGRIIHNTIYNNTAEDGSGLGGGIYSANGSPTIQNNIIDRNNGSGLHINAGSVANVDYNNVYSNDPANYGGIVTPRPNDINQQPHYLDAAEDQFFLLGSSPGIDAGNENVNVLTDIEGDPRPTNLAPDMGADEYNTCLIRVGGVGGPLFGNLQDAITHAEQNDETLIQIARGECSGIRPGEEALGVITTDLEIYGSLRRGSFTGGRDYYDPDIGAMGTSLNALGQGRVIVIEAGANPSFHNLAFVGGNANGGDGGGVYNAGGISESERPEFTTVQFCQNTAVNGGGYYGAAGSDAYLTGAESGPCFIARFDVRTGELFRYDFFGANSATNGGIFYIATGANFTIRNHGLDSSLVTDSGGGFYNAGDSRLMNAVFYNNTAENGGGIYNSGSLELYHNTIRDNTALNEGGGIYQANGSLFVNSSVLYANVANNDANSGGIRAAGGSATLSYSNIYNNAIDGLDPGFGSFAAPPRFVGIWGLQIDSPNIDRADPDLIEAGNDPLVDKDASNFERPDGDSSRGNSAFFNDIYGYASDVGASEFRKDFGCDIRPESPNATVLPGQTITYSVSIYNAGNPSFLSLNPGQVSIGYTDTLTITLSSAYPDWVQFEGGNEQVVTHLGHRDFVTRVMTVTVPSTATLGLQDVSAVQCRSHSLTNRTRTSSFVTNVGQVSSIQVGPSYTTSGVPGQVITFTHWITNTGNDVESVRLTPSVGAEGQVTAFLVNDAGDNVSERTVMLAPTESITAVLRIRIIDTAVAGTIATPGLVARPSSDPERIASTLNFVEIGRTSGTRYVAPVGANNTNCTSLNDPCTSIQFAHDQASPGDTILVAGGSYSEVIIRAVGSEIVTQTLWLNKEITILGGYDAVNAYAEDLRDPIGQSTILTGDNERRVIYVTEGITVNLQSLYVTGGNAGDHLLGGGLYNAGATLHISGTWFLTNTAATGAGLYHTVGDLTINSSVLAANSASADGAGLYVADGVVWLENNTFANNLAGETGAGLYQADGSLHLVNTIFANNSATNNGAAFVHTTPDNSHNLYFENGTDPINFTPVASLFDEDPDFIDGFYRISADSAAKDTGTSDVSLVRYVDGGLDFELESRLQGIEVDIGADELLQIPDFTFEPTAQATNINAGESHIYTHTLQNTGDFIDSYSLTLDRVSNPPGGNFDHALTATQGLTFTLEVGEMVTVTLVVTATQPGYQDVSTITAVSQQGVIREVVNTTSVNQTAGVTIGNSESGTGLPNQTVIYNHILTNTGDGPDSYSLTYLNDNPVGWDIVIDPTEMADVLAGATVPFTVSITIPQSEISGTVHLVQIEAQSAADPLVTAVLTNTTTVIIEPGLSLSPGAERFSNAGVTQVYTHTLTNLGNGAELVTLTADGSDLPGWEVTVDPPQLPLAPFASDTITVNVTVPLAAGGQVHTAVITATGSSGITATAVNTTTVLAGYSVLIEPDNTAFAEPGETVVLTHTVTNVGNLTDTYSLETSGDWTADVVPTTLMLAAGDSSVITVTITVPETAEPPTQQVTTVTATSANAVGSATNTITIGEPVERGLQLTPAAAAANGTPGTLIEYNHTLTNSGTETEDVTLSGISTNGWDVTVSPTNVVIEPDGEVDVLVTVQIPVDAPIGMMDETTVTAVSDDELVAATAVNTTTVSPQVGVELFPPRAITQTAGTTVNFVHTLQNSGVSTDTFTISALSSRDWPLTLPNPVTLPAGGETEITVDLLLPAAAGGQTDVVTVTATSGNDATIAASVENEATATGPTGDVAVTITPNNSETADPGTTVVYTHTIQNNGNVAETFRITLTSSQGWDVETTDNILTIAATQSVEIEVYVTIPRGAAANSEDITSVTVRSLSYPDVAATANNTTTAGEQKLYLPIITKPPSDTPPTPTPTPTPSPTPIPGTPTPTPTPIGCPTNIDLIVTGITVIPASPVGGEPATVMVSIKNQGNSDVTLGNNFYVDFYVNTVPQLYLIGDHYWGVQGSLMTAGTEITLTTAFTFTSGTFDLYAQVDTDNTVQECENEDNNILGPVPITVTGQFQGDPQPPARIIPGPRTTPTPDGFQFIQPGSAIWPTPTPTPTPTLTPRPN
jgi:uncharacterized membrane protein